MPAAEDGRSDNASTNMSTQRLTPSTSQLPPAWLGVAATLVGIALLLHGPIPQWADYHRFADSQAWAGVPNARNVLSNLPFALVGAWGFADARRRSPAEPGRLAWLLFCAALVCTAAGSSLYHLAPDNPTLVVDRLPIAWACAALTCAFLAERLAACWASPPVLGIGFAVATASVVFWWATERHGAGDLRPYLFVQLLPMLLVPLGLILRLPPLGRRALGWQRWLGALALYGLAKAAELADAPLFEALHGSLSGHTAKHLLAAAAAAVLVWPAPKARALPERRGG
jgi:hypothetical protein